MIRDPINLLVSENWWQIELGNWSGKRINDPETENADPEPKKSGFPDDWGRGVISIKKRGRIILMELEGNSWMTETWNTLVDGFIEKYCANISELGVTHNGRPFQTHCPPFSRVVRNYIRTPSVERPIIQHQSNFYHRRKWANYQTDVDVTILDT